MTLEKQYYNEASLFLEKLFFEIREHSIDYSKWDIDHLCFRTETLNQYEKIKKHFSLFSTLLIESPVNGRPIATYKLHSPWIFGDNFIDLVEIPAPKPNKITKSGFEHIEIVMPQSFAEIQKQYSSLSFEPNNNPKKFNPELVANLKNGDIKFHHQSLELVINIEKMGNVLSNLLHNFNLPQIPFFICGTFPISLNTPSSDIDVVISYKAEEKATILEWIQNFQDQTLSPKLQIKNDEMLFRFKHESWTYEFYMSTEPLFKQNAYRHLNIEARLLKIFGTKLITKVGASKKLGLNTEHAFLEALALQITSTKSFDEIYQFESMSELQISSFIKTL